MSEGDLAEVLGKATENLLYPSESDEPFEFFSWPVAPGENAADAVARRAEGKEPIVTVDVGKFFDELTPVGDYAHPTESEDAERFEELRGILTSRLQNVTVVRVGKIRIDVYIIGRAGGDWAGLRTVSVET